MDLLYFVTYKCNLQCQFCETWKISSERKELTPQDLTEYLYPYQIDRILFSGGEPFLRQDLVEIIRTMVYRYSPKAICILSNGQLTDVIFEKIKEIKPLLSEVYLCASLDGLGETHDKIRGKKGTFQNVINTLEKIPECGGISFTITLDNYNEILKVYEFTKELNINFSARIAHALKSQHFSMEQLGRIDEQLHKIADDIDKKALVGLFQHGIKYADYFFRLAWFLRSLVEVYKTQKRLTPCMAGINMLALDPYGDIYTCCDYAWKDGKYGNEDYRIGNIIDDVYEKSELKRKEIVEKVQPTRCQRCWTECYAGL